MVEKKGKRASTAATPRRNVRRRIYTEVPDLTHVTFAPLEDMVIDLHLKEKVTPDLKLADIYAFLKFSTKLPEMDIALVNEFLQNYNINDGSSLVRGRRIVFEESLISKALFLPVSELGVGDAKPPPDYDPTRYFRTGIEALDKKQGWKTGEAASPELMEWMRIAQKRLVLGRHGTYLAQKYLYAVTQTFNGMVFNWAAFVVERIYQELESKRKTGKIATLLGASYISVALKYQLSQPMTESDQDLEEERSTPVKGKESADVSPSVPRAACRTRVSQQPQSQRQKTVVTEVGSPSERRKETEPRRRSPVPQQRGEVSSMAGVPTEQGVREVSNALQQASMEPGKLKDNVIVGLEQLLDWVKRQTEPNYSALMAELKDVQAQAKRMKADCTVLSNAVMNLRAQKEEAEKEKDFYAAEAKRERDRNQIAYQTWQDEKKAMEDRMKERKLEHQRIKDDLDTALLKALNENVSLQESLRVRDHRLEQLEQEKSVVSIGVQTEEEGNMDQDLARCTQKIKLLEKQVRDLGEYNEELREKYEPDTEEETEEEEDEDDGFEVLNHLPSTKVGCATTELDHAGVDVQVQGSATPRDAHEELAPVADSVVAEQAVEYADEETAELVLVQAADSVLEVAPRNFEDEIQ